LVVGVEMKTVWMLRITEPWLGFKAFDSLAGLLAEVEMVKRENPEVMVEFSVEEMPLLD